MKSHTFSISEILKDGRVLVFIYARESTIAKVRMLVFDADLKSYETMMSLDVPTT